MRYSLENTRSLTLAPNQASTSMRPILGIGPTGATGPEGPIGETGPTGAAGGSDAATAGWVASGPLTGAALAASIAAVVDPAVAPLATKADAALTGAPTLNGVALTTVSNLAAAGDWTTPDVLTTGGSW